MTVVKRLSKQRRSKIRHQIEKAQLALTEEMDVPEIALQAIDTAMKLFNGEEGGGMRYDELNDGCEYFREKAGGSSLSVLLIYIEHWRRQAPKVHLADALLESECDMTHYWRCEAWNTEEGKRRRIPPNPSDERCTCGLKKIVAAFNEAQKEEKEEADEGTGSSQELLRK